VLGGGYVMGNSGWVLEQYFMQVHHTSRSSRNIYLIVD
jgi:hypothetical protein